MTATTGTLPNWIRSKARCHSRECSIPSLIPRSLSSPRSRPAEKSLPSPASTTALMSSASPAKYASIPRMVRSSSALRFSLSASHSVPTAPCRLALSELGKPATDWSDDILGVTSATVQTLVLSRDQGAAAVLHGTKRLLRLDRCDDLEHIPLALGFGWCLHLQQEHRMNLAAVLADCSATV